MVVPLVVKMVLRMVVLKVDKLVENLEFVTVVESGMLSASMLVVKLVVPKELPMVE